MTELKPCPFCGAKAEATIDRGVKYRAIIIRCTRCTARVIAKESRLIGYWKDKESLPISDRLEWYKLDIERAWNRRDYGNE